MTEISARGYVNSDVLVSTDWIAQHIDDPNVRIIESNEDPLLYKAGHIKNAVEVDWARDLNDQVRRDYLHKVNFESLMSRIGVTAQTTVVFYGDKNNWWACYAFWIFKLFNHARAHIMDGGRVKWEKENRPVTKDVPAFRAAVYQAPERQDQRIRAFRDNVLEHVQSGLPLVDVRSPQEFSGEKLHMEGYPNEGALRGGHIPGAKNIPWARAIHPESGVFKNAAELKEIYQIEQDLDPARDTIAYCRIGERSSHTWFVLTYLLGFKHVRNYDGSWTEWGNLVNVPIEKSA